MEKMVERDEELYRLVLNRPEYWKPELERLSSAIFKDSNGVSVDRDGERSSKQIIDALINRKSKPMIAVISIGAGFCIDLPTCVKAKPLEENEHHAEIHDSEEKIQISGSKTKKLSKKAKIVYIIPDESI